ncbi:DeoR/GlpR family DNA-binding transcription regulator [Streptomyces chiangmaiensis]
MSSNGVVSLREAQRALGVSVMTVRRDFTALEEKGLVRRTRGGVIAVGRVVADKPYTERSERELEAKAAIGRRAAALVDEGDTIFLSGGTTCLELARALSTRQNLTVITTSVPALTVLMANSGLTVIATGGRADNLNRDLSGPVAESTLTRFRTRKAFIGASGITADGVFNSNLGRGTADRLMVAGSAETFVLADHTKVGTAALALVAPLSEVGGMVTDRLPDQAYQSWLAESGVAIVVASDDAPSDAGPVGRADSVGSAMREKGQSL